MTMGTLTEYLRIQGHLLQGLIQTLDDCSDSSFRILIELFELICQLNMRGGTSKTESVISSSQTWFFNREDIAGQIDYYDIKQSTMDDSISSIHQKLRFLYQHKFLSENKSIQPYNTHNPIKYINHCHQSHTQSLASQEKHINSTIFSVHKHPRAPYSVLQAKSKTQRIQMQQQPSIQIEFRYVRAPKTFSFIERSRKQHRSLKSSDTKERNSKEKNRKTLYTLQQQTNSKDVVKLKVRPRAPSKKLSLIQMIEEKRLMDIRKKLKSQEMSTTPMDGYQPSEKLQYNTQSSQSSGYRRNQKKKEALQKGSAYIYSYRIAEPNAEELYDKDNQINPWPVSEAEY